MASNLQLYSQMADDTARRITGSYQQWTAFLNTAARLYKYPYNEQLMIYAQRPDATACAEYGVWNEKMGRYVRRGSRGIALVDTSGYTPRMKYVFDVADTGGKENARSVNLWQFREEHGASVSAMLEQNYHIPAKGGLAGQLSQIAEQMATAYWDDHNREILGIVANSFLEEYDNDNIRMAFRSAASASISYMLLSRCGLHPEDWLEHEDFLSVFDFNTPQTAAALGTAASEISEQVLRQIEVTVKRYEREHSLQMQGAERTESHGERTDLHPERGLSGSRPDLERDEGAAAGQVRADAEAVSDGTPPDSLESDDSRGDAVPAPAEDRHGGEREIGGNDAGTDEIGGNHGADESSRSDALGGADEHLQSPGGGSDSERADLQLSLTRGEQLSLFPTEAEQIAYIAEAESATQFTNELQHPSAFSFGQEEIDHVLRLGGNSDNTRMVVASAFQKQKPQEDIAAILKREFHGGDGFKTEKAEFAAWYADDGIHLSFGRSAEHEPKAQIISWQDAASRIAQLLENGEYASNVELAEAAGMEQRQLAEDLWYVEHDLSEHAVEQGYLSYLSDIRANNFPDETENLFRQLDDPAFRNVLIDEFAQFVAAHAEDHSLLRFHYYDFDRILPGLRDLALPRMEYSTEMAAVPKVDGFITDDEIHHVMSDGSGMEGGKGRIYNYFTEEHTDKEKAAFLKTEYGIGGRTHAISNASRSYEDHSAKGMVLKKDGCANVELKWTKVAALIDTLIQKDRFLTPEDKWELKEEAIALRDQNDYNAVKEAHPDDIVFFQRGDFFEFYGEDARQAAEVLEMNLTTRNIPGTGRVEMCGLPSHNLEMYVEKLRDKYDVTIAEAPDFRGERHIYTLRSIDHEVEDAINAYEAEFGADGTRVFHDSAAGQPSQPTVRDHLERYRPVVIAAVSEDTPYRNACGHSDRENAEIECNAAVRRAILDSKDMELIRLFSDVPEFRNRLHQEVFDGTYERLHDLLRPLSQDDIDDALRAWNGNAESKHAVVRYMEQHGRERETAAWLAHEYGGNENNNLFIVRAGSPETVELTWPKVQRRIAQLIREDQFFTAQEKDAPENNPNYQLLDRLRTDCEYFLGAGNRAEKHLWAGSVYAQIVKMRELYDVLPQKPDWLTKEMIDDYAERMAPRYQVVAYHHFENGFDEKLDYQTLEEAEKAAQGYVDGMMESDGFAYDGAAIYDQQARKYLRIYGNYPDERAHAEVAGRELVEEPALLMERAKGLISDFCQSEYGAEADFSDPAKIGVAYTTVTDDEIPIQVNIDLVNYRLERYLDDEHLETRQYGSLQEIITNELENLDFSDLIHVSDEDVEQHRWHAPEEAVAEAPETAPAPQREPFPYSVGDTVYLENGKPYIIESVGVFDITLSDPTLFYPISRAESRESFARLMERYPQPEKEPAYTEETVAVYPGDKNNLPYDVEIRTLRFDEPEHEPPSAEPAEPEPHAMSEEEALILEQEGRAALSEMGEFVPDFDDAISQAEIDEPPAHRPAVSIPVDGEWQDFPSVAAAEQAAYADFKAASHRDAQNFHITDDALGVGGAKTKYQANINAIRLIKHLEAEGLQASAEQQQVLSRYVGWGGLADAFDSEKTGWRAEYDELKSILTPEEYAAARASTLNAHYTSPTVIKAIYEAVGNMGFRTGNILEPSMGVGNFFGLLPDNMSGSRLYGVELDSITGRIAKQLYPKADITVAGFETTDRRDFFDLAVGNVPFGQYQVNDRAYNKLGFSIHDYFFAKALDQVRPGGIIAFVTSRYTMDKQSPEVRKYIAQRAELLGAIRLPNNAFKANAGTEVVSDIIFFQKRDRPIEVEPDWVHLGQNENGFAINSYFVDHPEMILGRQTSESTQYGRQDFTVVPIEGLKLADQLHDAVKYIRGTYQEAELPELGEDEQIDTSIPADPNVKNYSYAVVDGEVYYRENSIMVKPDLNATAKERVRGMVELRDCVQHLIEQQMDGFESNASIQETQRELNRLYGSFTAQYGLINSRGNALAFADDSAYYLLCSLEVLNENGELERKADIFTKRTIKPHEVVTSVDTASEALALSISEKACVDLEYMSSLTGKDAETLVTELSGVIFFDPVARQWQTADEYLSGDVREKLRIARSYAASGFPKDGLADYKINVSALEQAQPKDLDASEIEVRLGATWIGMDYIQQFMEETFEPPLHQRRLIHVNYSSVTAEWNISGKSVPSMRDVNAYMTYGTERANAYKILEDTLNLRDIRIYDTVTDPDGTERRILNSKETTLAQQKQQVIKDSFHDWIWKDPDRRQALVQRYNELFNSTRPREYDGSHIRFSGMNPEIKLREHQLNAVAHILYGGNTILAHKVGAGKTFEMVAAAMESKRLGMCQKALFVVPNHLTEQWASEFLRLYPSANILVTKKKDFESRNRKKFCARIATGDYDAVIIGHSQFERIPISQERQERLLQEQISEIEEGLSELRASHAERFTIKSLERTKRGLETRLKKLTETGRKDDVITFEQLGIDRLYVDEAHAYKNLFLYTKMRNVAGLSTSNAQKSSDMLLKCRYIDEVTGGKGVVFATGTPVNNSMTELFTMMRYLQHDTLRQKGLSHFDCWASTFGETATAIELAPEGTGYRARTRFSKFFNLPELMALFKESADIKTADQLNLPTPKPLYHNEVLQPTEIQKAMVQELSARAAAVHAGRVDASKDNMLKITTDGRKLGLDQRVINPNLPDDPGSKVNRCVENVFRIWRDGQADKLTQLVFCDLSTPKVEAGKRAAKAAGGNLDSPELHAVESQLIRDGVGTDAPFSVYDDIREKLVAMGIPREQIAYIHEANTEVRKKELFAKVRAGQVRVLMGSTFKMGAGMNVQDRLVALHDLDAPWRPGDLEQRSGRIIRQGNRNKDVHIYRYVTEGTFDAYLWQTLENKQKFISQIMTSKSPVRSCEDIDETALSFAEIKALCAGDERIKEKMDLDVDVARLKLMRANHQSQQYKLEDNILRYFPEQIEQAKEIISGLKADMQTLAAHPHPKDGFAGMEIRGDYLTDKENAGAALLDTLKEVKGLEPIPVGSYRGLQMSLTVENFGRDYILTLKGQLSYRAELGHDQRGNLTRIENVLNSLPERLTVQQGRIESFRAQTETAKAELGKPFPQETELREKSMRLAQLNAELNIDERTPMEQLAEDEPVVAKLPRPSVLQKLRSPLPEQKCEQKPKSKEMEV